MTGQPVDEPVHCTVCGAKLRTPESRRRGRGRVCDEKVNPLAGRDHSPLRLNVGTPLRQPAATAASAGHDGPNLLDELDGAQ